MKTEDVQMTEIALNPYLTLVLFSVPSSARTTNAAPRDLTSSSPAGFCFRKKTLDVGIVPEPMRAQLFG